MEQFENKDDIFAERPSETSVPPETENVPESENIPEAENIPAQESAAADNAPASESIPPSESAPDAENTPAYGAPDMSVPPVRNEQPINSGGGIFGEKNFSYNRGPAPVQGYTPYGAVPAQGGSQYRNMYQNLYEPQNSGYRPYQQVNEEPHPFHSVDPIQNMQQGYNAYQPNYAPYRNDNINNGYANSSYANNSYANNGYANNGYVNNNYQQPQYNAYRQMPQVSEIPPVSDVPTAEVKKTSKGWIIALIISVVLALSAVMVMLAMRHSSDAPATDLPGISDHVTAADRTESPATGVIVNINVAPKPLDEDRYYQDRSIGLLTPAGAAKQVMPSIVNLYGYTDTILAPYNEASGVIISEQGYIITNAHAVEDIVRVKAKLSDGKEYEAQIIGIDTKTDLAVLKIDADNITPAVLGAADELDPGEQVVAIGNADGYTDTVTVGCVSHIDREIDSYTGGKIRCVQTDAVLDFGNSGGALVNLYGQVVGIVTSKSAADEKVGFAIRTEFAVPIVEDIIEKGYVTGRPRVGIVYQLITADMAAQLDVQPGLMVNEISEECDISNTKIQPDDIIMEMDGTRMLSSADLQKFQQTHSPGDTVTAKVYRKSITGEEEEFEITFRLEENTGN